MMISTHEMLRRAQRDGYAIPAFNVHNLESINVVSEVATRLRSPLMIAFTPSTITYSGFESLFAIIENLKNTCDIPLTMHLDHHEDIQTIKDAIRYGVRSVMIDASHHSFEKNIEITRDIVQFAQKYGASVEAELGVLSGQEDDLVVDKEHSSYTDPKRAKEFVEKTGIDSLAVAIGTAHGLYHGEVILDVERLSAIRNEVSIPLVLHGASGLSVPLVQDCIQRGICKVNVATELKIPFAKNVLEYLQAHPEESDPRKYLTPAKQAMAMVTEEKIRMCLSHNRV
ncbi:tagatose-bisphosphate aldolase subunit GatY (plasmid) [Entomospira entomophila]|nr:tagatose-bisphosphate aldolase subunit GatY [Entomospira entomophilus]WDI36275.1 tagatose-bisphosphate aldolase subunit GatY [Entomospira entomophilus]